MRRSRSFREPSIQMISSHPSVESVAPRKDARPALLALSDGTVFEGRSFGAVGETAGEVVFNTSMAGYQEILTDPSYRAQIVVMTYPLIGSYGVNDEDVESARPQAAGFVVREYQAKPSNWRATRSLHAALESAGIVGIEGIDTRALTRHLRSRGVMEGVASSTLVDPIALVERARAVPGMVGRDLVREVTCDAPYEWTGGGTLDGWAASGSTRAPRAPRSFHVVAYDYGIKWNLLRMLVDVGARVTVVPARTSARDALALSPDGIFLSNGPGDPAALPEIVSVVRDLLGKKPVFGVCLGHQLMGLALGGRTFKLKFGHRGANQPVIDLDTRRIAVTSQNHGFAVDGATLGAGARVTHLNLNDDTVEGLAHDALRAFSVQHHPEASPGPHDAAPLFERFAQVIEESRGAAVQV